MPQTIRLGYSTCPNDTFIFAALAQGRVTMEGYRFELELDDVEVLNHKVRRGELEVSKVSVAALPGILDDYLILPAGGALGRGCGPLVVARESLTMATLRDRTMAIPGRLTTAHLLLALQGEHRGERVEMRFDRIMPAVVAGEVAAGLIIHEGRFTYQGLGLQRVLDLGEWWEERMGVPLPLGCIVIKRTIGEDAAERMTEAIRASLRFAHSHPAVVWPYVVEHAQEMEEEVIRRHIETFVNEFSLDLGLDGRRAMEVMLETGCRQQGTTLPDLPLILEGRPGTGPGSGKS